MGAAPPPPLPYRARPPQLLLGVGAVLVVCAAATALYGGGPARSLLLVLAALAAGGSAWGSWAGLRSTEETLAAAAVALALIGADPARPGVGGVVAPAALAATFLVLHLLLPRPGTWPVAAWGAAQVAALRALDATADGVVRTAALFGVALVGLGITLGGRRLVARVALLTTAPWWAAGVVGGITTAWTGEPAARWLSAALTLAGAAGLLLARLERDVDPLLGPPAVVPVLAGAVAGAAAAGALFSAGPDAVPIGGYAGVLLACTAAAVLTGWRRGLLLPVALAAGSVLVVVSGVRLLADARWAALCVVLALTAVPSLVVAARRPEARSVAVPTALGCLAVAALFSVPAGLLGPGGAAVELTVLYAGALAAGTELEPNTRRSTIAAGAACAVAAVALLVAVGARGQLALHLLVQGVLACAWAWWAARRDTTAEPSASPAWRAGAAQLVLAAWTGASLGGIGVLEAYTLPAAAGLLLAAGPRLLAGPSWPAWGPGLLVATAPSVVWAVVQPGSTRPVLVLVAAAAVMALAGRRGVRAPLVIGAGTALALALGLAVVALPLPVAGALLVGAALLGLGARRERRPVAGFGARLAEMR